MRIKSAKQVGILSIAASAAVLTWACTTANGGQTAQGAAPAGRQCFHASTVNSFHAVDRDTVLVTVGVNRVYQLDILGTCPEIDWTQRIGLRSTGGSDWICQGLDAELLVPRPGMGFDRCPVLGVRPLTPEEAQAARRASRR
jgi:hypothetical protein